MPTVKSTATQPLTGDVTTVKGTKKAAPPARMSRTSETTIEGEHMSLSDFARQEAGSIFAFEGSRIERWVKVIRAFVTNTPGDFERYGVLVKQEILRQLGVKPDTPAKTWPTSVQEQYKNRFAQYVATINRVSFAIDKLGKARVLEVLEARTVADARKAAGLPFTEKDTGTVAGYVQKVQALPKKHASGAPRGARTPKAEESSIKTAETHDLSATARSVDTIQEQAKKLGAVEVANLVAALGDDTILIVATAVANRLKSHSDETIRGMAESMLTILRDRATGKAPAKSAPKGRGKKAA